jgi:site-specific DNA-methyltransferase (adenine-specific)
MTPYYSHAGITIYHGDCRDILPQVTADVVVTDPPYGTGWVRGGGAVGEFNAKHETQSWDKWDRETLAWLIYRFAAGAMFGPASKADEYRAMGCGLWWYCKTNPRPNGPKREPIVVWPFTDEREVSAYNGDSPLHPCQKPDTVMLTLVAWMPAGTVLDPFMGSGTTLVAAKQLGRKAIGIEIEERYCEIAVKRLAQEVLPLAPQEPEPMQPRMYE